MQTIRKNLVVPYSTKQMYDLVNDIKKYNEFLPWCKSVKIHSKSIDKVIATLYVSKGNFDLQITTINKLIKNSSIIIQLKDGPFKLFEGSWKFCQLNNNCHISFALNYSFSEGILSFTVGAVVKNIMGSFVDSFANRANELYKNDL